MFKTDCKEDNPPVCFFDTPGTKFELYPLELLTKDIGGDSPPPTGNGFCGITLAYNVAEKKDVDKTIELVENAGGTVVKEPQDVFWGGYTDSTRAPSAICHRYLRVPSRDFCSRIKTDRGISREPLIRSLKAFERLLIS